MGAAVVAVLPTIISDALTKYAAGAIFGGTFGNFAVKYPKVAVFSLFATLAVKMLINPPAWVLIVFAVFGSLAVARIFYQMDKKKAAVQ